MRMNDNYNIITGELKPPRTAPNPNKRFASLDVLRKMKEQPTHTPTNQLATLFNRTLGKPKDHQLFQYSYLPSKTANGGTQALSGRFSSTQILHTNQDFLASDNPKQPLSSTPAN